MNRSSQNKFNLSKRIRLASKLIGYKSAFNIFGAKKLGEGAFGSVFSSKNAAVKVSHGSSSGQRGYDELEHEVKMLQQVQGIKVAPKLLGSGKGYAAIQKFEGKQLTDYVTKIKQNPIFADYIFRKIVEALGALHRKNIAQRDLHAGNIFITNDYQVKILDYGQASKGYAATYYETFFGNNGDPSQGSVGLIMHLFDHTKSFKTYKRILTDTIKKICTQVGADPKLVLLNYEDVEGDDVKEVQYFEELSKITLHPKGDTSHVKLFYNALDTALKINTRNPSTLSNRNRVVSKTPLLPTAKATKLVLNRKTGRLGIPKAKDGGVFSGPDSGYLVELHGTEAVIPLDDIDVPPARYIQGQSGVWELEFESVIDHAIYFAGKSRLSTGSNQLVNTGLIKKEILDWLEGKLGLTWKEISDHREKILDKIRELTPGAWEGGNYPYLKIPRIDPDFEINSYIQADEEEDDIPEGLDDLLGDIMMDDEEDDDEEDDIPEGLDDLLGDIRVEEENNTDEKEVDTQAEIASEVLTEAEDAREQAIDESVLDDLPESLRAALVGVINKKTGTTIGGGEQKKTSSYVSNNKIFKFLTTNLYKIQGQLDSIDRSLQDQTSIVQANLQVTSNIYENLDIQNQILGEKLDAILQAFNRQNELAKKFADDEENRLAAQRLAGGMDAAGTETPLSTIGSAKGSERKSRISLYYRRKLLRKLYRKLPKKLRSLRIGTKKLQRIPGRIAGRIKSSAVNRITKMLPKKASNFITKTRKIASGMKGGSTLKGIGRNAPGLKQALAALEYSDRKSSGQSDLQAVAGVGGGLAGASIGASLVGLGIAALPTAPTGVGALVAGALILTGSILGGTLGGKAADTITGADKITGEHETGGLTKPGTAILHGTEAVVNKNNFTTQPVDPIGGTILAATTQYINKLGPIGSSIAPTFKQVASPLAKVYGMPSTLVQTNVGGSLPSLQSSMRKVKEKRKLSLGEQLDAMETDLLKTTDPGSFADKLLKMIDPEGKFQELLEKINNPRPTGETTDGMATFGETGIDKGGGYNAKGFVHGHFQNSNKQALINDTFDVVKKLVTSDAKPSILGKILTKDSTDAEIKTYVEAGVAGHKTYGSGVFAIDVSVPTGTKVPVELENVYDSKGTGGIIGTMKGRTTQIMHLAPGSKAGAAPSSTAPTAQGLGKQGVTSNKDFGATSGVGNKGYLIIPGHASGLGAPEEKKLVKQLAKNAYINLKSKFPDAKVQYQDTDAMFEDTEDGFKKQLEWFKQKEKEGWEILEVHMDASMESGQGTGRGAIVPTGELNPVEAYFAQNYGAYSRGHRDLGAPKKGVGLFELGNMSPELEAASKQNKVSKKQLDSLTAPLEQAIQSGLNISPPTQRQPAQSKYYLRQGSDSNKDTQIIMIPAASNAGQSISKNATIEGQRFTYDANYNAFKTPEISSTTRALVLRRLGLN
jgi:serine/threonine protein kinase